MLDIIIRHAQIEFVNIAMSLDLNQRFLSELFNMPSYRYATKIHVPIVGQNYMSLAIAIVLIMQEFHIELDRF